MKLCVQNDSVRLRLTLREARRIGDGRSVAAQMRLPGATLRYRLVPSYVDVMSAALDETAAGTTLTVRVPRDQARAWALGASAVMSAEVVLEVTRCLLLRVEKDFICRGGGDNPTEAYVGARSEPALP